MDISIEWPQYILGYKYVAMLQLPFEALVFFSFSISPILFFRNRIGGIGRAASALPLLCLRVRCETGVNQALLKRSRWKRLSSRDQWNLTPATMCHGSVWSRRFGAAQTMHSHKCDHFKFLLAHSQKMVANATILVAVQSPEKE